jgi:tetratricopeptide (TPR) repeat protein
MFGRLITALLQEGDKDKALKAADYCMKVLPPTTVPNDYSSITLAEAYYRLGQKEKAEKITEDIANNTELTLKYFYSLNASQLNSVMNDVGHNLAVLQSIIQMYTTFNPKLAEKHMPMFQMYSAGWNTSQQGKQGQQGN